MGKLSDIAIKSASGQKYKFSAFTIDTVCREMPGVYVVTRRQESGDGEGVHHFLSVGHTDNLRDWRSDEPKIKCWDDESANCIAVLIELDFQSRQRIVQDIRESFVLPCD